MGDRSHAVALVCPTCHRRTARIFREGIGFGICRYDAAVLVPWHPRERPETLTHAKAELDELARTGHC